MPKVAVAVAACLLAACARSSEKPSAQTPPAPAADAGTNPRSCMSIELTPLTVARIDESQRRLFVVAPDAAEGPIAARIRDLEACFDLTEWAGRWSVSVFTDATLARYKDDPKVTSEVGDGRWARAYVAEYDAATRKITRSPAGPP